MTDSSLVLYCIVVTGAGYGIWMAFCHFKFSANQKTSYLILLTLGLALLTFCLTLRAHIESRVEQNLVVIDSISVVGNTIMGSFLGVLNLLPVMTCWVVGLAVAGVRYPGKDD